MVTVAMMIMVIMSGAAGDHDGGDGPKVTVKDYHGDE